MRVVESHHIGKIANLCMRRERIEPQRQIVFEFMQQYREFFLVITDSRQIDGIGHVRAEQPQLRDSQFDLLVDFVVASEELSCDTNPGAF